MWDYNTINKTVMMTAAAWVIGSAAVMLYRALRPKRRKLPPWRASQTWNSRRGIAAIDACGYVSIAAIVGLMLYDLLLCPVHGLLVGGVR